MSTHVLDERRTGRVMFRPIRRSRTSRAAEASNVRRFMRKYDALLNQQAQADKELDVARAQAARASALQALLQARAAIDRALWLETSGRLGERHATTTSTLRTLPTSGRTHDPEND